MMLFVVIGISVSAVMGYIFFRLGFHLGNQMSQTQHIRDHLEQTRPQRQTMNPQQLS